MKYKVRTQNLHDIIIKSEHYLCRIEFHSALSTTKHKSFKDIVFGLQQKSQQILKLMQIRPIIHHNSGTNKKQSQVTTSVIVNTTIVVGKPTWPFSPFPSIFFLHQDGRNSSSFSQFRSLHASVCKEWLRNCAHWIWDLSMFYTIFMKIICGAAFLDN